MAQPPYGRPPGGPYPSPPQFQGAPPLRRRRSGLAGWLIAAGLAGVLVVALGIVAGGLLVGHAGPPLMSPSAQRTLDAGADGTKLGTVDRPGYHDISEGIADPAPLAERGSHAPMRYGDTLVIPACALLTLTDLKKHGLLLVPNPLGSAYRRSVFDGQGRGAVEKGSQLFFPVTSLNSCQYLIEAAGHVEIEVFQEEYTSPSAMVYEFKRYDSLPAIAGVSIRRKANGVGTATSYLRYGLRLGKTAVRLTMKLPPGADTGRLERAMLVTVAGHLRRASLSPTGTPTVTYDSPLLTSEPASPCAAFRAEDFHAHFGRPPAPFVEEIFGSAVGRTDFSSGGTGIADATEYAYTYTECKRFTGEDAVDRHTLTMAITSYTADAAAEHAMVIGRQVEAGKPLKKALAADAYCVTRRYARATGALAVRQGRFLVIFSMTDPDRPQDGVDPGEKCESMRGLAERVASRLKG
ncbi:hypothetical protein [Nonomuraea aurantiaca]|uniref:hypothetical protein n=1 Tax=Nonomuraea aurantiaca TaxID=2878562 RepID=UPI001CDA2101|nr:hypothetical protein [Nonomuraea aurantiaca]MCA2230354.1 hypothetical protein [Nonomuraea aurantiaca]